MVQKPAHAAGSLVIARPNEAAEEARSFAQRAVQRRPALQRPPCPVGDEILIRHFRPPAGLRGANLA